jgi:hypothetical protein
VIIFDHQKCDNSTESAPPLPTNVNKTDSTPSSNSTNVWEGYFKETEGEEVEEESN